GGLFSGNMRVPDAQLKGTPPRRKYLEYLFGDRAELRTWGLRVLNPWEPVLSAGPYVSVTVLQARSEPAGILVQLAGLQLAYVPKNASFRGSESSVLRPSELHIATPAGARIIALSWERPLGDAVVGLERREVPSGDNPPPPKPI